ncbi:MBOAT family O-acyltransferase [Undibacterium rugosum]|uniref:Probable alginate O-acetylase AlgI n=1 Tax=Undibacterium rugosum TaxID=2762291 RepID=A0A923KZP4_9BURK|nr:MBOAT family O-acyltransferase [Undibacterium rugosum]MBC3936438.1 MBOAT family protein [Undibacterium rugosum]MBR7779462.1 MBOAT family protein [Undibacterium rugosum]
MVFASLEFLTLFLPLFFALYLVTPQNYRNHTLLVGSWIFYAWWTPKFLILIIALTLLAWGAAILIDKSQDEKWKTRWMAWTIVLNLASLVWYKYTNMLVSTLNEFLTGRQMEALPWEHVMLPIALSFTVLHAISYVVDVRRKVVPAQYDVLAFSAYMAMFPHLIAGPIVRYKVIDKELRERVFSMEKFSLGVRRFMIGFSMKVLIADTLAPVVALCFGLKHPGFWDAWVGCIAYTLQLYFDFAGYSAMAIGLGLMLGFHFEENFNNPYLAVSIQDFWRRWHQTLSSWLRDYLYISLGGNRQGPLRTYVNLMLTMAIGGLWHGGDNWNYLIWGIIQGTALCCDRAFTQRGLSMPDYASRALTMLTVMFAWTIFRASGFDSALGMWAGQLGLHGFGIQDEVILALRPMIILTFFIGLLCVVYPATPVAKRGGLGVMSWSMLWPVLTFCYGVIVLAGQKAVPFLYFQF